MSRALWGKYKFASYARGRLGISGDRSFLEARSGEREEAEGRAENKARGPTGREFPCFVQGT